jgi:hypothetical protein
MRSFEFLVVRFEFFPLHPLKPVRVGGNSKLIPQNSTLETRQALLRDSQ